MRATAANQTQRRTTDIPIAPKNSQEAQKTMSHLKIYSIFGQHHPTYSRFRFHATGIRAQKRTQKWSPLLTGHSSIRFQVTGPKLSTLMPETSPWQAPLPVLNDTSAPTLGKNQVVYEERTAPRTLRTTGHYNQLPAASLRCVTMNRRHKISAADTRHTHRLIPQTRS